VLLTSGPPATASALPLCELAANGQDIAVVEIPSVVEWTGSPQWTDHPLAWLPLSLTDVEGAPEPSS